MSNEWGYLYDKYLPIMKSRMDARSQTLGNDFCTRYWDRITKQQKAAYEMTMRCEERLRWLVGNREASY